MIFQCGVWDVPILKCYLLLVGNSRSAGVLSFPLAAPRPPERFPLSLCRRRVGSSGTISSTTRGSGLIFLQTRHQCRSHRNREAAGHGHGEGTPRQSASKPECSRPGTLLLSLKNEPWVPLEHPSAGTPGSLSSVPLAGSGEGQPFVALAFLILPVDYGV